MRIRRLIAAGLFSLLGPEIRAAFAQAVDSVPQRVGVPCNGQVISDIIVVTQPPFNERLPPSLEFVRRTARRLHSNTRDDVVRRYLLMNVGDPCNEVRRQESERILRAQPFLVDARIAVVTDPSGGVRLEVQTRDEFSVVAEVRASLKAPMLSGVRIGEQNLRGAAVFAALQWRDGGAYNDLLGLRVEDYQFFGQRNILRLSGTRAERGHEYDVEMLRPYVTDLQRFGWHGKIGGTRDYASFIRPGASSNALGVNRTFEDVGAVVRVGSVRHLKLVGVSLTHEAARADQNTVQITPQGFRDDTLPMQHMPFQPQNVTRLNALLGLRRLRFERVTGFDALTGVQDVRVGVEIGTMIGHSISFLSPHDHDAYVMGDVYAGVGSPSSFLALQTLSEARRDHLSGTWDGALTSGRLAWYFKPAAKQLTLAEMTWAASSGVRVPYQLSFADRDGGMYGYRDTREPGAHRVVMRAEQRMIIPTRYNVADAGIALFAEMGKLWAGDAPYAQTSPVRGSVGIGLLAAVPPKSRRLWRLDFALPLGGDPDAKFEIRFSNIDRTRTFWRDPHDVARARERTAPTSLFSWP